MNLTPTKDQETIGYRKISACRVCGSVKLATFWDGRAIHVVEFPKLGTAPTKPKVPLELAVCEKCWLVQLMHTTDPAYLYEEFHYRSGVNEMMRAALKNVVTSALHEVSLEARSLHPVG